MDLVLLLVRLLVQILLLHICCTIAFHTDNGLQILEAFGAVCTPWKLLAASAASVLGFVGALLPPLGFPGRCALQT